MAYFSANVASSLIPIVNMTGVMRTVRPANIPLGNDEYTLSVNCIVIVYEYLNKESITTFSTNALHPSMRQTHTQRTLIALCDTVPTLSLP